MAISRASTRNGILALGAGLALSGCGVAATGLGETANMATAAQGIAATDAQRGHAALAAGDAAAANAAFDRALAAIGDSYVDERALDETGMKLTLARQQEKQGDLAAAAKGKGRVVDARLKMLHARP